MRSIRRAVLLGSLATLLAACCPAPLSETQGSEIAFVATVLAVAGDEATMQLESGERLRVRASGLEAGQQVYVRGQLSAGRLEAESTQPLAER